MTITALRKNILFQFKDIVKNGMFKEVSESGLYLGFQHIDSGKKAREAVVKQIGSEVQYVQVGDTILIEPLQWTEEFKFDGQSYWLTTEDKVIGVIE